jgi:hypothetical protein
MASFALAFFAVAGQTGWILRPYLVRPRTTEVPFVRATEGGLVDAVFTSVRAAAGIYDRADNGCVREPSDVVRVEPV